MWLEYQTIILQIFERADSITLCKSIILSLWKAQFSKTLNLIQRSEKAKF